MCVVSMVVDDWYDRWKKPWINQPLIVGPLAPAVPMVPTINPIFPLVPGATKEEVDALRREVEILKEQIARAKKYDKDNGEPDCSEKPDKVAAIRKVIEALGLNPDDVLKA